MTYYIAILVFAISLFVFHNGFSRGILLFSAVASLTGAVVCGERLIAGRVTGIAVLCEIVFCLVFVLSIFFLLHDSNKARRRKFGKKG